MTRVIVFLLFLTNFLFSEIKIVETLNLDVSIDPKSAGIYVGPPVKIYDGFDDDLILSQFVIFEVFNKEGSRIKKVGGYGRGPGDFVAITGFNIVNNQLYCSDQPNYINIFDNEYKFKKRIVLSGHRIDHTIYDIVFGEEKAICVQHHRAKDGVKSIIVYNKDGSFSKSFFETIIGKTYYNERNLINGNIIYLDKYLYHTIQSVPKIWKLNLHGDIIDEKEFGIKWWKKINYNEEEHIKKKKRRIESHI